VQWLLKGGADREAKNNDGWTPLWFAAMQRHETIMQRLLHERVDIERKDDAGWTPLHWAANNGRTAVV